MRFSINNPKDKTGDRRTIKRFAFLPLKIYSENSEIIIWLEFYDEHQSHVM